MQSLDNNNFPASIGIPLKRSAAPRSIRRIAVVGCGYVADAYGRAFDMHPGLTLVGAFDRDPSRTQRFSRHFGCRCYDSLDELLGDREIDLVLNLTNPAAHYEVSRACLSANKHLYSEKPLALQLDHAEELVALAEDRGLRLSAAPCSLLGETAQTLWRAVRENRVGRARLVYAELDEGLLHRMPYRSWLSESGVPWPYRDEFEVGNMLEHAGYYLTWLVAFFGPVESVTAFGSVQVPDKEIDEPVGRSGADVSVSCLRFTSGVVARMTCSIVAPHNHSLQIFGDEGVLGTDEGWDYRSPVWVRRRVKIRRRVVLHPWKQKLQMLRTRYPMPKATGAARMDWLRGVADMADSLNEGRSHRLTGEFVFHVCEVLLAIDATLELPGRREIRSRFDPIEPMTLPQA